MIEEESAATTSGGEKEVIATMPLYGLGDDLPLYVPLGWQPRPLPPPPRNMTKQGPNSSPHVSQWSRYVTVKLALSFLDGVTICVSCNHETN